MQISPQDILKSFDILPEPDQRVIAAAILQRAARWESAPLSDDDLAAIADELFVELDRCEAKDGESSAQ
jgi:hypothetical protein